MPSSAEAHPTSSMEIRRFRAEDREPILRLMSEDRAPGYLEAKTRLFDWQFIGNPLGDRQSLHLVGVSDGQVVASNGLMPVRVIYKGKPVEALWSCDTFVARSCRGRGYGKALLAQVSREAPIMLAYGITDMSDPIFIDKGWELNADMTTYYCSSREPGARGMLKTLRSRIRRLGSRAPSPLGATVDVHESEDFPTEVDDLWSRSVASYHSVVAREAAYLNWKYRRHPRLAYVWYSAREGGRLRGLLVVRAHPLESVVVDYCGPRGDAELIAGLIQTAVRDLERRGTARIRCETTDPTLASALRSVGFFAYREKPRFRVRTNLPDDPHPEADWFVMTGDSDHDLAGNPA
jgi:GNAT superfamily N-acetyltransferase